MLKRYGKHWVRGLGLVLGLTVSLIAGSAASGFGAGPATPSSVVDGWSAADVRVLASMRLNQLPSPPHDPSNAVDGLPGAIVLGQRLFNDARLSGNSAVSCATCHDPQKQFQDGLPMARGMGQGSRRSMPLVGAAYSPWLFWDGRKDSLWAQALGPLEDAVEHGGTRARYAHVVQAHYREEYEALFPPLPDLSRVPQDAAPAGTPEQQQAWKGLDATTQTAVNRVFVNMGKAIAAFEKTLQHNESRFDRYVERLTVTAANAAQPVQQTAVEPAPQLTPSEVNGLRTFISGGQCVTCHNGPLLTDQHFHNTGVPPRGAAHLDRGRAAATVTVRDDVFNCLGPFSDAKPAQCQELRFMGVNDPALEGAFKTPSLRGVAQRAPYMHAGQMASLQDVVQHYVRAPAAVVGHTERSALRLTDQEARDLVAFLGAL
ncbi:MAG: cytochrome-c peroxidase [Polaromonas sp.]|nr:cytochrome-c peroxidase [Polaromonas sp.]